MQAERRLLARREQDPDLCRRLGDQHLQPGERVFGVELVQVVDHQPERLLDPLQLARSRSTTTAPAKPGAGLTRSITSSPAASARASIT